MEDAKRLRSDGGEESQDPVIGLEVSGRRFYCHLTTLTNASGSMLAARFGSTGLAPGDLMTRDELRRPIYFIDRDPQLFEYILTFLRSNSLPWQLRPFSQAPQIWRGLRREAAFYGLHALSELLQCTKRCEPLYTGDKKGVLYWLGCRKGHSDSYQNPCAIGAIRVTSSEEGVPVGNRRGPYGLTQRDKDNFVENNPTARVTSDGSGFEGPISHVLCCGMNTGKPDQGWGMVELCDAMLCPTHYSLWYSFCCGTKAWNFSASVDGTAWDYLHQPRDEKALMHPSKGEQAWLKDRAGEGSLSIDDKQAVAQTLLGRHSKTWKLDPQPTKYYRFFRISGVGDKERKKHGIPGGHECVHGCGFELYGDVYEE